MNILHASVIFQIHIGRGVWLSNDTYILAAHNIKFSTKRKFVRNILISIFGHDVLASSTISGRNSNRSKNNERPNALDPTKLLAVKGTDFFLISELLLNDNFTL